MTPPIRIAICGGGLAGVSLLYGLLHHPHLDVHVFEAAATFNGAGAAISIARNALTALDLLGPSAVSCLERAGAFPMQGVCFMLAQGEGQGELIAEQNASDTHGKRVVSIVHRAAFLRELLGSVSPEHLHAAKKLEKVDQQDGGSMTLHFADGTTHECDILVGADGIHSTVRKLLLGDDPAASPRNTGAWAITAWRTAEEAHASLGDGPNGLEEAREYSWVGDGVFVLHNMFNQGQIVQFIVAAYDEGAENSSSWKRIVTVDELRDLFKDWPPHLRRAVDALLCAKPEHPATYLWEHAAPAPTYAKGGICLTGDAAHGTTPWQGAGGGLAIEDSLILSTLLGRAASRADALLALQVYDRLRRPRTQRVVASSRETGLILAGRGPETGLDLDKLRDQLLPRWDFIVDFDVEEHRDEAVRLMDVELAKRSAV